MEEVAAINVTSVNTGFHLTQSLEHSLLNCLHILSYVT